MDKPVRIPIDHHFNVTGISGAGSTASNADYDVELKTDKEVAYSPGDVFLLSKLEDPKQRFLARGTP